MKPQIKTGKLPYLPVLAGLMILIPVLIVAGCTENVPVPGGPAVDGTRWALTGYISNGTFIAPYDGTTVTLEFAKDGTITGSGGCNNYFASYEMKGTKITIGRTGSTLMYCSGPGVMEQESAYLSLLTEAASVTTEGDTLTFADVAGTTILSFTRLVPPAPEPLVGTNWTLDSFYSADAVSSVISGTAITAVFDKDGRVSGSAGCNNYFASYSVIGSSLSISSTGSTKMYCTGPGVMMQEDTYLASLKRAATFTINGARLTLADEKGASLLSFTGES